MGGDTSSDAPWEDDEEDADFDEGSVLDAFDVYTPADEAEDVDDPWDALAPEESDDDQVLTVLFTATNPAGTVSVTALMDGRVLRVELSPQVTRMTGSQLAEEITVISALARQQAEAGQHAIVVDFMRQLGQDPAWARSFLERELGLPSPDTVKAERARIFATRYADDHD